MNNDLSIFFPRAHEQNDRKRVKLPKNQIVVGNFKKEDNWLIAYNKMIATANRIIKRQKAINKMKEE
jgi:hypothetical protein